MTWREVVERDVETAMDDEYGKGRGHCTVCATEWDGKRICHCGICHLTFTSVGGFDYHRIGHGDARRCRTAHELTNGGYQPNDGGQWRKPAPVDLYTRKD